MQVLVIEGDADKLAEDGMHIGPAMLRELGVDGRVIEGRTTRALNTALAQAANDSPFEVVIVIAHGNTNGLRLVNDADGVATWRTVADHVARFRPRMVLVLGCHAGLGRAADAIFRASSDTLDYYACPVKTAPVNASRLAVPLVLRHLNDGRPAWIIRVADMLPATLFNETCEFMRRISREERVLSAQNGFLDDAIEEGVRDAMAEYRARWKRRGVLWRRTKRPHPSR